MRSVSRCARYAARSWYGNPPASMDRESAMAQLSFESAREGDSLPVLKLPPITRLQLALYCGGSGDHNPIHVDTDFAKRAGMKDVFAHGMLSMGFMGRLITSVAPQSRVKSLSVRFVA